MSVLIVRDLPGFKAQVLLDGKDITGELVGLVIRIELGGKKPDKKIVILEHPEPVVIDGPVVEVKFSPDVLMEGKPAKKTKSGGKHATN